MTNNRFEAWYEKNYADLMLSPARKEMMREAYDYGVAATQEGFEIGEEIEYLRRPTELHDGEWLPGIVTITAKREDTIILSGPPLVRHKAVWKPNRGDPVLVEFAGTNITIYAVAASEYEIYSWEKETGKQRIVFAEMKPFDVSKIGWSWSEV
jgi:hypothetical protein